MDPITLFLHFQGISSSGLLSLRYPPIYQAFTTNFAWANFILPIHSSKIAAKKMRKCDLGENPTNQNSSFSATAVPPVSSGVMTGETTGIDAYALKIGINPQDIFGIAYLAFLCAFAILLVLFLLVGSVMQIGVFTAKTPDKKQVWLARRQKWIGMSSNNSLRIVCTYTFVLLSEPLSCMFCVDDTCTGHSCDVCFLPVDPEVYIHCYGLCLCYHTNYCLIDSRRGVFLHPTNCSTPRWLSGTIQRRWHIWVSMENIVQHTT
jgi:hypothetical protein